MENLISFLNKNAAWLFSGLGMASIAILINFIQLLAKKHYTAYSTTNKLKLPSDSTSKKLDMLGEKLSLISTEIDETMRDLAHDIEERKTALQILVKKNTQLSEEESQLKNKVETLKDIPIEVAEYFKKINQEQLREYDKRNSRRDITMFILGILATTVVSIIVTLLL